MIDWRPTAEYALYLSWTKFTEEALGHYVPVTHIGEGRLQHIVADGAPSFTVDGEECRTITLVYDPELLEQSWTTKH